MGLAKGLRWIEAVGGAVRLESKPGQGARMLVMLPVAAAESQGVATSESRKAAT